MAENSLKIDSFAQIFSRTNSALFIDFLALFKFLTLAAMQLISKIELKVTLASSNIVSHKNIFVAQVLRERYEYEYIEKIVRL